MKVKVRVGLDVVWYGMVWYGMGMVKGRGKVKGLEMGRKGDRRTRQGE